jgi:hypothetical protein
VMPRPASLFTDPTTWRERAEGMRVLADEIRDAETNLSIECFGSRTNMIASPNEPKSVRGARQSDARASIRFEMTRELASMPRPASLRAIAVLTR